MEESELIKSFCIHWTGTKEHPFFVPFMSNNHVKVAMEKYGNIFYSLFIILRSYEKSKVSSIVGTETVQI